MLVISKNFCLARYCSLDSTRELQWQLFRSFGLWHSSKIASSEYVSLILREIWMKKRSKFDSSTLISHVHKCYNATNVTAHAFNWLVQIPSQYAFEHRHVSDALTLKLELIVIIRELFDILLLSWLQISFQIPMKIKWISFK